MRVGYPLPLKYILIILLFLLQCSISKSEDIVELNLEDPNSLFRFTYNLANEKLDQVLDKEERISHYSERRLDEANKYIFSSIEVNNSNYKLNRKIAIILSKVNEKQYLKVYSRKVFMSDLFEIDFFDLDKDGIEDLVIRTDYCGHMCTDEQLVILKVSDNKVNTIFQKGISFSSPEFCGHYDNEVVINYNENKASIAGISIAYKAEQGLRDGDNYCKPIGIMNVRNDVKLGKLYYAYQNGQFKVVGKDFDYRKYIENF